MTLQVLQTRAVEWARHQDDIRAMLAIGSTVRRDHPADEWSDLDLLLFSSAHTQYFHQSEWLHTIGTVWLALLDDKRSDGCPEYLVIFEGGFKADFLFFPMTELERLIQADPLPNAYFRGYRILLDKDGLAARIPSSPFASPQRHQPTAQEFNNTVNHFWYAAFRVARSLARQDLWTAKQHDRALKDQLVVMIEWHAQSRHNWDYDTWHSGRFMREWVDPQTWAEIHHTFGGFDAPSSWAALQSSIDLFRRLAAETAQALGYTYDSELDTNISQYIAEIQTDRLMAES